MTKEQKEFDRQVKCALNLLQNGIAFYKNCNENGRGDDLIKMFETAHKTFSKLREEWKISIGEPAKINSSTISEVLQALNALVIEQNYIITFGTQQKISA